MGTTDFNAWLDQADPDTTEEIYALHEAISSETTRGMYEVKKDGDRIIIKVGHMDDALIIDSNDAKNTLLSLIDKRYMDGNNDAECWYGFQRNMDNPKA